MTLGSAAVRTAVRAAGDPGNPLEVLSTKELAYVEAARGLGASQARVMGRHLAPKCVAPLLVIASFNLGTAIFAEAALSFLGVGVPPPTPTWGSMLGGLLAEAFRPPSWLVVFPGLAITRTIVAANLFGDALRDFVDPRLKAAGRMTLQRRSSRGSRKAAMQTSSAATRTCPNASKWTRAVDPYRACASTIPTTATGT